MKRILYRTIATLLLSTAAASAQLSWGTNGAGGSGTWDGVTADWFDGTNNVTWDGAYAVFGGTGGAVTIATSPGLPFGTLSTGVFAEQLIFNSPGYTISGGILTAGDGSLNITTNADATINSVIQPANNGSNSTTFVKDGAGTLTISGGGSLASFQQIQINNGNLYFTSSGILDTTASVTLADTASAALTFSAVTWVGALNGGGVHGGNVHPSNSLTGGATLYFSEDTGSYAGSLQDDSNGGKLSIGTESNAFQTLTGTNTYSGTTSVESGTLSFAGQGSALNTSSISIAQQGTLVLDNSGTNSSNRLSDTAAIGLSGNLIFIGNKTAPSSETLGGLTTGTGQISFVTINPNPAQSSTLTFASLTNASNLTAGVAVFRGANLGATPGPGVANILLATTPSLVGSGGAAGSKTMSVIPYALGDFSATGSGTSFVTYDTHGIRPLSDAEYANNDFTVAGANVNVDGAATVAASAGINSLRLKNGAIITGSGTLSIASGTLLQLPGVSTISNSRLDFGANPVVLDIQGTTNISSVIADTNTSQALDKLGNGRLVLSGANTYAGSTYIASGVLNIQNSSALGAGGANVTTSVAYGAALEIQGSIHVTNESLNLVGSGLGVQPATGALRSISGDNIWDGRVTGDQAIIGVDSGSLTLGGFTASSAYTKVGNGSLVFTNAVTGFGVTANVNGGWLVSTAVSSLPIAGPISLTNGGFELAPAGSGGALSFSNLGSLTYAGGASLEVSKGNNTSVSSYFSTVNHATNGATLIVVPGSGLSALGGTESVRTQLTNVGGIVGGSIVGQDNDANRSGTFLTANASGVLIPVTYSANTDLNTADGTTIFQANTGQALTADRNVRVLQDNGQMIDLGGRQLSVATTIVGASSEVILNGGTIQNGTLNMSAGSAAIYTSLAGGTISTPLGVASAPVGLPLASGIAFFGPGKVTLSSANVYTSNTYVNGGNLNLQGSLTSQVLVAPGAMLSGTGRTTQGIGGGTISPGDGGAGILTASSVGTQELASSTTMNGPTNFAFEFTKTGLPNFASATASGNDLLRLTNGSTPFSGGALTTANEIDLYFNVSFGLQAGQTYMGGFFTDNNAAFDSSITGASYKVFVSDPNGATSFDGATYNGVDPSEIAISTVPETAAFSSGSVNGYAMEVQIVVPEPGTLSALLGGIAVLGLRRRRRE